MNAISARLDQLEKDSFPSDTQGLLKEVKEYYEENQKTPAYKDAKNPDDSDPVYRLFKWSYARQHLGYVVFVAAIIVSILTYWEFIRYLGYTGWAYIAGIIPVVVVSGFFAWFRYKIYRKEKRRNGKPRNEKNEVKTRTRNG
jgi:hypothetical protein